ncbi:diadenosine tetraphosphate (Ap4A) HIT family hydrolase [Pseudarthrobacter oxydans]|uniref:HIT family protein n=1 Tax=Pseudarthrobacter oxydans TaxID=1671 RepID=UPI00278B8246|nr:HIT family protein [Pseudarthrobacter oxydans]MDP9984439.1 diadenosine tetraphosphate (Ap4A) HIT family hydrolase [Pseudarthrobacter oxydans]
MPTDDDDCLFCQIVRGSVPSNIVFEDDLVFAFMDTSPINPGHLLVIPKDHAAYLEELDEETGAHMFRLGHRLAKAIRRSRLRCEGVNLFLADGEAAFQEVFHAHLHVLPRFNGDSFRIDADWQRRSLADLEESANQVRSGLQWLATSVELTPGGTSSQ